jgi:Mn2+/Fe2+ NRAMP family transporter
MLYLSQAIGRPVLDANGEPIGKVADLIVAVGDRYPPVTGLESGVDKRFEDARPFFGIYTVVLAVGALVALVPGLDLLRLIVASQNLQGLLLPVVLVFMVLLVNDGRIMGRHRNGRLANVLAWGAVALVIALDAVLLGVTALGIVGIKVG